MKRKLIYMISERCDWLRFVNIHRQYDLANNSLDEHLYEK